METYEIEFVDLDATIECPENRPILDVAEEAGLELPYQCREGVCGVCCAEREDGGEVDQIMGMFLSPSEKEEGYVLTCIAEPESDLKLHSNSGP